MDAGAEKERKLLFSQIYREAVLIFAVIYKVNVILLGHLVVLLKHNPELLVNIVVMKYEIIHQSEV